MRRRFCNYKKNIIILFLYFTAGLCLCSPSVVKAEALQKSTAEVVNQKNGWVQEASARRYYKDNEPVSEGWHYLPESNNEEQYDWFYFLKGGLLYDPPQRPSKSIDEAFSGYTGKISAINDGKVDYEYCGELTGWYSFYPVDRTNYEESCYYVKNIGLDDYAVCRFFDGRWYVMDDFGAFSLDSTAYSDSKRWSVLKNHDNTFTFINKKSSKAICLKDDTLCAAELYDIKADHDFSLSEEQEARPEFFGAKGDGLSDDTFPIFYALNNSDSVLFTKTYDTTRTIDVKRNGVTLKGENGFIKTHTEFRTFMVKGKDVTFDSITFQGNYSKDEASDNSSIFFITEKDDGDAVDYNAVIKNCKFIKTGHRCIHIHSARASDEDFTPASIASGITIKDCLFDTYKLGVCCSGPDDIVVDNCTFKNSYYEHITFDWRSRNCKALNNHFVSGEHGVGAIGLDTAENIEIKNNDFTYTDLFGVTLNNEAGKNKNIVISGNRFKYGGGFGGVYFQNKSKYGVAAEDVTIINNTFDNANSDSVILNSAGGTVTFSGNKYLSGKPVVKDTDATVIKDF